MKRAYEYHQAFGQSTPQRQCLVLHRFFPAPFPQRPEQVGTTKGEEAHQDPLSGKSSRTQCWSQKPWAYLESPLFFRHIGLGCVLGGF